MKRNHKDGYEESEAGIWPSQWKYGIAPIIWIGGGRQGKQNESIAINGDERIIGDH